VHDAVSGRLPRESNADASQAGLHRGSEPGRMSSMTNDQPWW